MFRSKEIPQILERLEEMNAAIHSMNAAIHSTNEKVDFICIALVVLWALSMIWMRQTVDNLQRRFTDFCQSFNVLREEVAGISTKVDTLETRVLQVRLQVTGLSLKVEDIETDVERLLGTVTRISGAVETLQYCVNPQFVEGCVARHPVATFDSYEGNIHDKGGHVFSFMRTTNTSVSENGIIAVGCRHGSFDGFVLVSDKFVALYFPESLLVNGIKRVFIHDPATWSNRAATDLVVVELERLPPGINAAELPLYENRIKGENFPGQISRMMRAGTPVYGRTTTGFITGYDVVRVAVNQDLFHYICMNKGSGSSERGDSGSLIFALNDIVGGQPLPLGTVNGRTTGKRLLVAPLIPLERLVPFSPVIDRNVGTIVSEYITEDKSPDDWTVESLDPEATAPSSLDPDFPQNSTAAKKFSRIQKSGVRHGVLIDKGGHDWNHFFTYIVKRRNQRAAASVKGQPPNVANTAAMNSNDNESGQGQPPNVANTAATSSDDNESGQGQPPDVAKTVATSSDGSDFGQEQPPDVAETAATSTGENDSGQGQPLDVAETVATSTGEND